LLKSTTAHIGMYEKKVKGVLVLADLGGDAVNIAPLDSKRNRWGGWYRDRSRALLKSYVLQNARQQGVEVGSISTTFVKGRPRQVH
jgi:hypothetical protein